MLWLHCTFFWASLVLFLLNIGAEGSDETPREGRDKQDEVWFHFTTRPDIHAPKYDVHIYDEGAIAPGTCGRIRTAWSINVVAMQEVLSVR